MIFCLPDKSFDVPVIPTLLRTILVLVLPFSWTSKFFLEECFINVYEWLWGVEVQEGGRDGGGAVMQWCKQNENCDTFFVLKENYWNVKQ